MKTAIINTVLNAVTSGQFSVVSLKGMRHMIQDTGRSTELLPVCLPIPGGRRERVGVRLRANVRTPHSGLINTVMGYQLRVMSNGRRTTEDGRINEA